MTAYKILMSNLGYLRGIDGRLSQHIFYAHRHVYCSVATQKKILKQLHALIERENPDLCCFVEIDSGSSDSANFNQLEALAGGHYNFHDIENKYAPGNRRRTGSRSRGKSNAFLAKHAVSFEKIYFEHGVKRLIYKIALAPGLTLFFAHFSLRRAVRAQQFDQVRRLMKDTPGESIFLGDFNIMTGVQELAPILQDGELKLMNKEDEHTFTFHRFQKLLDLCICSASLAARLHLRVVPQPFSDHAALLLEVSK